MQAGLYDSALGCTLVVTLVGKFQLPQVVAGVKPLIVNGGSHRNFLVIVRILDLRARL